MPSPKNTTRTLAEVREECIALGLVPARSIAQCEARIQLHRDTLADATTHGTGVMQVTTPGSERHVKFAEFAKAAEAEAPENITAEEEAAMRDYSAEQRRIDTMGETAWLAEQFKPCACGGNCTGETGCTQQPEAKRAEADRVAEKTARHAMAFGAGAGLFMSAAAALGQVRTSPDLREMARAFDRAARNKPRASVPGSVRRKLLREASKEGR